MTERREAPENADERATLLGYLDYQRDTLALKCEGLSADDLRRRAVPPSTLSLLGLVRHAAEVERSWFRMRVAGEAISWRWVNDEDMDAEFNDVDDAGVDEAFTAWAEERASADAIIASRSLDDTFVHLPRGTISVRWLLVHLIEEYARHNGHADLLRECIDGATGA
jgi:uncharacterized damage-inducible protein DinB